MQTYLVSSNCLVLCRNVMYIFDPILMVLASSWAFVMGVLQ